MSVLSGEKSAGGVETAALEIRADMKSGLLVAVAIDFDDAAEFPSVLGRVSGGANSHGLELVDPERLCERGRAVVEERDAIDHVLHLVLGAARVKDTVGFEQPAGFSVHHFEDRSAGPGGGAVAELILADVINQRGAGIEQRCGIAYSDGGFDRCDAERDAAFERNLRAHLDHFDERGETVARDLKAIAAEGKGFDREMTGRIGGESIAGLAGLAGEGDGGFERQASGVADLDAQFAGSPLGEEGSEGGEDQGETTKHGMYFSLILREDVTATSTYQQESNWERVMGRQRTLFIPEADANLLFVRIAKIMPRSGIQ